MDTSLIFNRSKQAMPVYRELNNILTRRFFQFQFIPAAATVFPGEIYRAPRSWTERSYHKLIYFHAVEKGGHFAAWEQPQLFAEELRAAFRSLR
jgi:hypothetical protein